MGDASVSGKKRKSSSQEETHAKKSRDAENQDEETFKAGKVKKILLRNFMCHDAMEVEFNPNVNFIVGHNGSGKSAILTALTVGLGAKAHATSRGNSLKSFVKKGKQTAMVEITLYNKGTTAYKPEVYGDFIIINRTIGTSAGYKIKNQYNQVMSKRKRELDLILQAFNIQIDNPISVMNQDISRSFLVASKPEEKYDLFMKATLLDLIGNNYKEAEHMCKEEYDKLKKYNEILAEIRKEVKQLKLNIKRVEGLDQSKAEVKYLEKELKWAVAIEEERKLDRSREYYEKCEKNYKEVKNGETTCDAKCKEIDDKISALQDEIKSSELAVSESAAAYAEMRQIYRTATEQHSMKTREWRTIHSRIKRLEDDKNTVRKELNRLANGDSGEEGERIELKQQLTNFEQKLDDVEAMLRKTQTDQMQFQADKMRLAQDRQGAKIEVDSWKHRIEKLKREVQALKSRTDNALNVFGVNIPRLLRRIKEEFNDNKFYKMPRGPLGAYITVKDQKWAPAVEYFLGRSQLTGFCVDNAHDSKVLSGLIKEVYGKENAPPIICSKFYENVHNVSKNCVRSPDYPTLIDVLEISDPVVANCLIDQSEVETVLLIPTSDEAAELLSEQQRIPKHCRRACTYEGDIFYPDPRYRCYGGPRDLRAKLLQVSMKDAIQGLEDEQRSAEESRAAAMQAYTAICEKEKRNSSELEIVNAQATKLRAAQNQYKSSISDLRDKVDDLERLDIQVFKDEMTELDRKMEKERSEESRLAKIVADYKEQVESAEEKIKRHKERRQSLDAKVNPINDKITQLREAKEAIRAKTRHANKRLNMAHQTLQAATVEYETQQRVTDQAVSDATNVCQRINSKRSQKEIDLLLRELKLRISEIERQFGNLGQLRKELERKEAKYGKNLELAARLERSYETQIKRLKDRKEAYVKMKCTYAKSIQHSFTNILALRKKKGVIRIDHSHKTLAFEVRDVNDKKRSTNDARSLSGGERSYSTVAFILALWDCTGLPFYLLDEFDVFMDSVNRRVIMDILLDHTKTHPQSQFTFLTPLDTSHILAEDYVTIHRLEAPERKRSHDAMEAGPA